MYNIRPFEPTNSEYEQAYAIRVVALPRFPTTLQSFKHWDNTRDPDYLFYRDVIEQEGQIIAYGVYGQSQWSYHPDKYYWDTIIHPDHEHPDIRSLYLQHVLSVLTERNPLAINPGMPTTINVQASARDFRALVGCGAGRCRVVGGRPIVL